MAMPLLVEDLLNWVVPGRDRCREVADELLANHPGLSREELARKAVGEARRWAAGTGGMTGLVASPITMLPAALADMGAMLRLEGQMAGVVAALLDPPTLMDKKAFDADVITVVFPGAVSQALRTVGVRAGQQITRTLIQKYLTESFVKEATRFAGKYLMIRVTERAVMSKTVPLVGAGIGAAWNFAEMEVVGRRAIRYYQNRAIGGGVVVGAKQGRVAAIKAVVRRLPWRKRDREAKAELVLPPPPPPPPPPADVGS